MKSLKLKTQSLDSKQVLAKEPQDINVQARCKNGEGRQVYKKGGVKVELETEGEQAAEGKIHGD